MPFCTECGKGLESEDNFCPWCGTAAPKVSKSKSAGKAAEVNSEVPLVDYESRSQQAPVSSTTRVAPIYGLGFREGVHCWNCGSKPGNVKKCQTCSVEL